MHGFDCHCPTCHDLLANARAHVGTPRGTEAWALLVQTQKHSRAQALLEAAKASAALDTWMRRYAEAAPRPSACPWDVA